MVVKGGGVGEEPCERVRFTDADRCIWDGFTAKSYCIAQETMVSIL